MTTTTDGWMILEKAGLINDVLAKVRHSHVRLQSKHNSEPFAPAQWEE
jgi:hypothetical protein